MSSDSTQLPERLARSVTPPTPRPGAADGPSPAAARQHPGPVAQLTPTTELPITPWGPREGPPPGPQAPPAGVACPPPQATDVAPPARHLAALTLFLFLTLATGLGLLGAWLLQGPRPAKGSAAAAYAAAAALFLYSVSKADTGAAGAGQLAEGLRKLRLLLSGDVSLSLSFRLRYSVVRALSCALALATGARAAADLLGPRPPESYWRVFALWLASIALYLLSVTPRLSMRGRAPARDDETIAAETPSGRLAARPWTARLLEFVRAHAEALAVLAIVGVALAARVPALGSIPYVLSGDEAVMGLSARDVLEGKLVNMFGTGWLSHPTLHFFLLAGSLKAFGDDVAGLRTANALIGTLAVAATYFLARAYCGRRVALVAGLFLATYHFHIHYSRQALNNIADTLWASLAMWLLWRAIVGRSPAAGALAGLAIGLSQYFYMGGRLIPLLALALLLDVLVTEARALRRAALPILAAAVGFLVGAGPLLAHYARRPDLVLERGHALSIFATGWLDTTARLSHRTIPQVLLDQVQRSLLAFHLYPDPTSHYGSGRPLLDALAGLFLLFGVAYALVHRRERAYRLLLVWLVGVLMLGGALLENPPSSARLVLAAIPVAILVAVGIARTSQALGRAGLLGGWRLGAIQGEAWGHVASGALALAAALLSLHFYFSEYTPSGRFGGRNTELADRFGRELRQLRVERGNTFRVYFMGKPRLFFGLELVHFQAGRGVQGVDIDTPLPAGWDWVERGRPALFASIPERREELNAVRARFSGGRWEETQSVTGPVLYLTYLVESP